MEFNQPTPIMRKVFLERTHKHIADVRRNLSLCTGILGLEENELHLRGLHHDDSKFSADEENAYIWLSWMYHMKKKSTNYELPKEIMNQIGRSLKKHASKNSHHPEFYAEYDQVKELDLVEMVCDWTAIAEENNGGGSSCRSWALENLDVKWSFSADQKKNIFHVIEELDKRKAKIMLKELHFMRHGESEANVMNLLCGDSWDANLTDLGRKQVEASREYFENQDFDFIVSSPLIRARESAEILATHITHGNFLVIDDLKEQSYGTWERKPFIEIKEAFLNGVNPPGGESHEEFALRLSKALNTIKELSGKVLVVAHGGVGSELMSLLGLKKELIDNAQPMRLI